MIGRPRDRILLLPFFFRGESPKNHSGPGFETANNFNDNARGVAVAFEAIAEAVAVAFVYYCCYGKYTAFRPSPILMNRG